MPISRRIHQHRATNAAIIDSPLIVGASIAIQEVLNRVKKIGNKKCPVIVIGETGTGKELVARRLHNNTSNEGKFIALNCGAIPKELTESILFGHKRGAFTGAVATHEGLLSAAHKGTLFLDEIARLDLQAQAKLLVALETKSFLPVGDTQPVHSDFRIIVATQENLLAMVHDGRFLSDLYYRLSVMTITIPPLRERIEDIPLLVAHLLSQLCHEHGITEIPNVPFDTLSKLQSYSWPGNVRELHNVLFRALIMADGGTDIEADDIYLDELPCQEKPSDLTHMLEEIATWFVTTKPTNIHDFLRLIDDSIILHAIQVTQGVLCDAAQLLGVPRKSLYYYVQKKKKLADLQAR